jgi:hypothetical protein
MAAKSSEKLRFWFVRGFLLLLLEVLSPWRHDAIHPLEGDGLAQVFAKVSGDADKASGAVSLTC